MGGNIEETYFVWFLSGASSRQCRRGQVVDVDERERVFLPSVILHQSLACGGTGLASGRPMAESELEDLRTFTVAWKEVSRPKLQGITQCV